MNHKANKPTGKYLTSKIDGKEYCWVNGKFKTHLREHGLTYQEYYETYITHRKEFCPYCATEQRKFNQGEHDYTDTCGSKACQAKLLSEMKLSWTPEKNAEVNARRAATVKTKYGVEFVAQAADVKSKIADANHRVVTEDGKTSKQVQQEKSRATKEARYGNAFYNNPEALKQGIAAMTPEARNDMLDNRRRTCIERYGVPNQLMRPEITSKVNMANAKLKSYVLPNGIEISVQGYEPHALDRLFQDYAVDQVAISDARSRNSCGAPVFTYVNVNGNRCLYYPDIFIPHENRIIEVKSRWWYDAGGRAGYESRIENNRRKKAAAEKAGYVFEFWVYDTPTSYVLVK